MKTQVDFESQPHLPFIHPAANSTCCVRRVSFFCPVPPSLMLSANSQQACQAGRQCHHSAASSSARLNTGSKVRTAAGSGRCTLPDTCNYTLAENKLHRTHTHFLILNTPSPFDSLTLSNTAGFLQPSCGSGPELICMRPSWYFDGDLLAKPSQISLTLL